GLAPRSLLLQRRAAGKNLGAILPGARDETSHALELLVGNERAHLGVGSEWVADLQRADRRYEVAQHAVVDARSRDDARRRGAVLTGVEETADLDAFDDRFQLGVVEHDHRGLAAQLEVHALQG